jgi:tetratricopeptide (TPR) repeat protein
LGEGHPRGRAWRRIVAGLVAVAIALEGAPATAARASLTGLPGVSAIYARILDADFEGAAAAIDACAGVPREACDVLDATRLWWRILLDPDSTALDAEFLRAANRAIASTEAWVRREPSLAEAWFYLGGAYGARVQWQVQRLERFAAARDGKRIKAALERALALDPALEDANFGIGLYQYYAAIAPTVLRLLRVLLLLPGGDRREGLARMLRARDRGQVLRDEADYQLHVIDLWYEGNFRRALGLLRGLEQRYPRNPLFPQLAAEVLDVYVHDRTASLDGWRRLLALAGEGRVHEARIAAVRARLGAAAQLDALFESDAAIAMLRPLTASPPAAPFGAAARAWLQTGLALDRLGEREQAAAALKAAVAACPPGDPYGLRAAAHNALRRPSEARAARAYRLSIEGARALERGDVAAAGQALRESLALNGADPVARYRQGRVLIARGDEPGALREFERVVSAAPASAPTFHARAALDAAAILERQGHRSRAIELFERAASVFGAASDTRDAAARDAARLRKQAAAPRR